MTESTGQTGTDMPLYNIGVVTRLTNISTATLRAWERRYNFPKAKRTSGGHRLYSENDILKLIWVKQKVDEGMQTAQAINALRYQEEAGVLTLRPAHRSEAAIRAGEIPVVADYRNRLLTALTGLDGLSAEQILGEVLAFASSEAIILELIAPVMAELGEKWERNEIDVATEHFATNFIRQKLLMWMLSGPPPMPIPPTILACAPDELHEGSLLILGAVLRRKRIPIVYLGQAVPLRDLVNFIRLVGPSFTIVVAMMDETVKKLIELPELLPEAAFSSRPLIGYGGRIFTIEPKWKSQLPGIYLGDSFQEGLARIERLLITESPFSR
jgi:DNA-binding transcriptional MerR regulator